MGSNTRALVLGCCGVLVLCVVQFILLPSIDYAEDMARQVDRNGRAYIKLSKLTQEYCELVGKRRTLTYGASSNKGTLFAIVEKVARDLEINENIDSVRPQQRNLENELVEEEVQLRFQDLYQHDLVAFLFTIEKSLQGITVNGLSVKTTKDQLIDADILLTMTASAG